MFSSFLPTIYQAPVETSSKRRVEFDVNIATADKLGRRVVLATAA
jgi:hypothetical protein